MSVCQSHYILVQFPHLFQQGADTVIDTVIVLQKFSVTVTHAFVLVGQLMHLPAVLFEGCLKAVDLGVDSLFLFLRFFHIAFQITVIQSFITSLR